MQKPAPVVDAGVAQGNDHALVEAMQRGTAAEERKQAMEAWILGLTLGVATVVVVLLLRFRRRPTEAFTLTLIDTPPHTRKPIMEVDLPLDLLVVATDEPERLGYVDSTVPAVQDPVPFKSAGRI